MADNTSMAGEGTPTPPRVYAILGAHRSGTSWLAGSLQEQGLELGEVNTEARFNRKGNRESERLWRLHEAILRECGGSWRHPPERIVASEAARAEIAAYIAEMDSQYERWGFKDPRALLVFDTWRELVPAGIGRVGIYRHPVAVAESLIAREPELMDHDASARLWCAYNARLVREHEREPFPILRFDVEREILLRGLAAVARMWALPRAGAPSTFFAPDLRHSDETLTTAEIPESCRAGWDYLERNVFDVAA